MSASSTSVPSSSPGLRPVNSRPEGFQEYPVVFSRYLRAYDYLHRERLFDGKPFYINIIDSFIISAIFCNLNFFPASQTVFQAF
jgi:hypothetical protein